MLDLARRMVVAGLARKESRGAHARPHDYPDRDDENFLRHTMTFDPDGEVRLDWKPVTMTKWQPGRRRAAGDRVPRPQRVRDDDGRAQDLALRRFYG